MDQSPQARILEDNQDDVCHEKKIKPKQWYKELRSRLTKFGCRCMSGEEKGEVYVKTEETITEAIKGDDSDKYEGKRELPPVVYNPRLLRELAGKVVQKHVHAILAAQKKRGRRRLGFKKYDSEYDFRL